VAECRSSKKISRGTSIRPPVIRTPTITVAITARLKGTRGTNLHLLPLPRQPSSSEGMPVDVCSLRVFAGVDVL